MGADRCLAEPRGDCRRLGGPARFVKRTFFRTHKSTARRDLPVTARGFVRRFKQRVKQTKQKKQKRKRSPKPRDEAQGRPGPGGVERHRGTRGRRSEEEAK